MRDSTPDGIRVESNTVYRFGEFELRAESGELFRDSVRVRLQEQSFQVLLALLEKPGSVVSREQMREHLWPEGTYVDFEQSLNAAVKRLRAALEDDAESPRFIETLPRRGYRLNVAVTSATTNGLENIPTPSVPELAVKKVATGPLRQNWVLGIKSVVVLLLIASAVIVTLHFRNAPQTVFNSSPPVGTFTPAVNGPAYELYLRSLAYRPEPPDNRKAIELLERSTRLEPGSSRSWYELSRRYHFEYLPGGRGQGFLQQAREANRHALELSPEFSPAKLHQVMLDVEAGQLGPAYNLALEMTKAHPQDGNAHFALSYVLRFGGMFKESAEECEVALQIDPDNRTFRSCSMVYILLAQYDRALRFIALDPSSTYSKFRKLETSLLTNDRTGALEVARSINLDPPTEYPEARLVESVLSGASRDTVLKWSRQSEELYDRINHSEGYLVAARYQSFAGQTESSLRLLRRAIANNYCSYPAIDSDPLLSNIRRLPEYAKLRTAAIACRDTFRAYMQKPR